MRGTQEYTFAAGTEARFIPACAGNTIGNGVTDTGHMVHPRVCGEHCHVHGPGVCAFGSSPRVRGTPIVLYKDRRLNRFIPACAGNTPTDAINFVITSVHPRVCGEHLQKGERPFVVGGSSPRVRGTRLGGANRPHCSRFIPACAGNTSIISSGISISNGSSPRVRGTRDDPDNRFYRGRFIPACAGNTISWLVRTAQCAVHPRVCGEHFNSSQIRYI